MSTVLDQGNRTFIGSVLFLDIVGYTKKSVSVQIAMKDRFTAILSTSLKDIAADQRIILDTGDGAAITFLGDPEDALFVAMQLRDALKQHPADPSIENEAEAGADNEISDEPVDVPIRTGINLGPVKLVRDINGQPNIVGDGINVAQRIMSFAPSRQIVVSRSFYDMVSVISEEYSKLFTYEGSRTDKHVRDHEIYVVGESAAAFKQAQDGMADRATITQSRAKALKTGRLARGTPAEAQARKKYFITGGALAIMVVVLSLALALKTGKETTPANAEVAANAPDTPVAEVTATTETAAVASAPPAAPTPQAAAPEAPAILTFGVQPWGEVFIDGKSAGVSPPLKQIKLPAGAHAIEVRNTTFPTFSTTVDVKPKETRNIAHKF